MAERSLQLHSKNDHIIVHLKKGFIKKKKTKHMFMIILLITSKIINLSYCILYFSTYLFFTLFLVLGFSVYPPIYYHKTFITC